MSERLLTCESRESRELEKSRSSAEEHKPVSVGKRIGRGRLWTVYEGVLSIQPRQSSAAAAGIFTSTLDISLNSRVWESNQLHAREAVELRSGSIADTTRADTQCAASPAVSTSSAASSPTTSTSGSPTRASTVPTSEAESGSTKSLSETTRRVPVAIKFFDATGVTAARENWQSFSNVDSVESESEEIEDEMAVAAEHEVEMCRRYLPSAGLEGRVTPKCFAYGEWRARTDDNENTTRQPKMLAIVQERLYHVFTPPSPPVEDLWESEKIDVARLLHRLHRAGWAHGDVELRHVMMTQGTAAGPDRGVGDDPIDSWRLIDFDRASQGASVIADEREVLLRKFGFTNWVDMFPDHLPSGSLWSRPF